MHADVPGTDWNEFTAYLNNAKHNDMDDQETIQNTAMWSRKTFTRLERAKSLNALDEFDCTITGIDHVFTGHTVVSKPIKHCNRSWIDTGAYKTNVLTFIEIDDWITQ